MQQGSNKNTAIIGLIAIVIIGAAVVGTIALKPKDTNSSTISSTSSNQSSNTTSSPSTSQSTTNSSTAYKDGTYTASGTYSTPESVEDIEVTITISNNTVANASISQQASSRESREYQADFASGYKSQVIGKAIADLELSRVSGSSLTPRGFNEALNQIRSQAAI